MIALAFTIEVPEVLVSKRAFNRVLKAGMQGAADAWHAKILPKHFEPDAKRVYKHQPRTLAYLRGKARRQRLVSGDTRDMPRSVVESLTTDLVSTGKMKSAMMRFKIVKAFKTRFTVRMNAPFYMTMTPNRFKGSNQPHKFGEIETTTARDIDIIEDAYGEAAAKQLQREFDNPRARRKV
jgi:hypothetical protein